MNGWAPALEPLHGGSPPRCRLDAGARRPPDKSHPPGIANAQTLLFLIAMSTGVAASLWGWGWRPRTRMGPLMYLWPTAFIASDLAYACPESRLMSTSRPGAARHGADHAAQTYPRTRRGKPSRAASAWFYIFWMVDVAQVIQRTFSTMSVTTHAAVRPARFTRQPTVTSALPRSRSTGGTRAGGSRSSASCRSGPT